MTRTFIVITLICAIAQQKTLAQDQDFIRFQSVSTGDSAIQLLQQYPKTLTLETDYGDLIWNTKMVQINVWDNQTLLKKNDSLIILTSYEIRKGYGFWLSAGTVNLKTGDYEKLNYKFPEPECRECGYEEMYFAAVLMASEETTAEFKYLDYAEGIPIVQIYRVQKDREKKTVTIENINTKTKKTIQM